MPSTAAIKTATAVPASYDVGVDGVSPKSTTSFLSLSHQADLHFGHCRTSACRGIHKCPHRLQTILGGIITSMRIPMVVPIYKLIVSINMKL